MLRVFQSVRGLSDDSVSRLDKNEDLALEMIQFNESTQFQTIENRFCILINMKYENSVRGNMHYIRSHIINPLNII